MTISETFGSNDLLWPKIKVAWVGDANNILNSMAVTFPRLGIDLSAAFPKGYSLDSDIMSFVNDGNCYQADNLKTHNMGRFEICNDPLHAVKDAHIIVTDTWVSMGQEGEKAQRLLDFAGFQVNS